MPATATEATPPRRKPVRTRTSLEGTATAPSPQRTGAAVARPDRTAAPAPDEASPPPAETKGPVQAQSPNLPQHLERELPGPHGSQVQQVNPQRNIVRRIPR